MGTNKLNKMIQFSNTEVRDIVESYVKAESKNRGVRESRVIEDLLLREIALRQPELKPQIDAIFNEWYKSFIELVTE